jgi:hypothetical protein
MDKMDAISYFISKGIKMKNKWNVILNVVAH